jgi:signal transduction histidine kinase
MLKTYMNRAREVSLLYLILIFSVVLLLLVAWLVNEKFSQTAYNFKKVNEGHLIINDINDLEHTLTAAGTSVRSYLITRDVPEYEKLPVYHKEITDKMKDIRALLSSYPDQKKYIDSLSGNIETRFGIWNLLVSVSKDSLQAINDDMTLKNTNITGNLLNETSEIRNHANNEVETYINDTESGIKDTGIMALSATLLCVTIIIFSLYKLNSEVRHGIVIQAELKRKVQELDRSNADLERFAYVASHDLHAPLRKLYAFSEILMEREKNLSPEGLEIIGRMHSFVTRMQKLIDDMLEFSLNFNKVEKKTVDLNQLVRHAISNLAISIAESKATIDVAQLPDRIVGFESQLNQLFQNIISNSIKYSKVGVPPHIKISVSVVTGSDIDDVSPADIKKKFHKIVFADNGIGFSNKYKEKIFVIFQRLHGKSEYEGTGIGLATCKRVMENHDGYITASGEENEGAQFAIYFPVA